MINTNNLLQQAGMLRNQQLSDAYGADQWGNTLAPEAEEEQRLARLAASDPQAYNRLLAQKSMQKDRPNPFGGGGIMLGGAGGLGGFGDGRGIHTQMSVPGRPAGSSSVTFNKPSGLTKPNGKSKYINPFS